jgi:hypothetical protein
MKYIVSAWYWLVFSSTNPQRVSLTIKAFLTGLLTYSTVLAGFGHIQLPIDLLTQLVDGIVAFVQTALLCVSIAAGIVGLIRKIATTFSETNQVIQ